jgi:small subunit ribosomal protein S1|tara:strand:+ start:249 stop:1547 length:1299 start_codon:yes stop_codon:yes gene_type:complete
MTNKSKRARIGETTVDLAVKTVQSNTETVVESTTKTEELEDTKDPWYNAEGEFMWDEYEATCITRLRKPNKHIKTRNGDKVYSRELYAQELYDKMEKYESNVNMLPELQEGAIYDGTVFAVSSDWITVDIGYRESVYIKFEKEPESVQALKPGETTSVLITTYQPGSHVIGSISGGVKQRTFMDLRDGVEKGDTAWVGTVVNMIENGGYIVSVQGIDCFMPGSLAGINKLHDFSSIIGTELYVVPVSFSPDRGTLVVSHRKYLQALIPSKIEELKETIDNEQTGHVTGTAKYGVFVEFNMCLTGMIHNNDLDEETLVKFKAREIKPGDAIAFKVKDIVSEKKITLTQKANVETNPWVDIQSRYQIPSNVIAKVKTKKDYGLFITIEDGVTGLLHISEIGEDTMSVFKPGDEITVQITRIDVDSMKVFLKLPQ